MKVNKPTYRSRLLTVSAIAENPISDIGYPGRSIRGRWMIFSIKKKKKKAINISADHSVMGIFFFFFFFTETVMEEIGN